MEEQDAAELLVEIGDNVEELTGIGVFDGDHHLWLADEDKLEVFKHQAISYRLPPLPTAEDKRPESLKECEVEIKARSSVIGTRHRLEVVFTDLCKTNEPSYR